MNKSANLIYPPIPLLLLAIASIVLLKQPNPFLFSTAFSPPQPLVVPLPLPPLLLTSTTTAPVLGILGSLLFKPRSIKIVKSSNYPSGTRFNKDDDEDVLTKAVCASGLAPSTSSSPMRKELFTTMRQRSCRRCMKACSASCLVSQCFLSRIAPPWRVSMTGCCAWKMGD